MNKKVIVENLEQLIEEHKKEKTPYKTYEFDSDSYTLLLIDINKLKKQLEKKDKIIDEAIEFVKKYIEFEKIGDKDYLKSRDNFGWLDYWQVQDLLEILGKR